MKVINKKIKYSLVIIALIILTYVWWKIDILRNLTMVIIISFLLYYSLRPIHTRIISKGINSKVSGILLITAFLLLFMFSFFIIIPTILKESGNVYSKLEVIDKWMVNMYENLKLNNNKIFIMVEELIGEKVNRYIAGISANTLESIISIGENALSYAVVPVLAYYFLIDEHIICEKLILFFPVKKRRVIRNIAKDIDEILGRYIISQFILCLVIGVFTFISLMIFKIEFPLLLSIINAIFNIIPYFGPIFGAIPIIIIALFQSTKKAIWVTIFLYIIQQIEGDIISPKIIGYSTSIHPMIIILLILIGGEVGGLLGLILAVPIGVILKVIYEDINYYLF
ncbi:AI-2E family transporter [Clostridium amazonitimonense]|uniref:AI-2E family transporter n=1 Tax=Clostridium amazonitimonense TaxID=1499689 RepID=UPI0005099F54|nr:AI-2E family transporter [Clostridium amazonitimonense]